MLDSVHMYNSILGDSDGLGSVFIDKTAKRIYSRPLSRMLLDQIGSSSMTEQSL